jgi:hypothetical protein
MNLNTNNRDIISAKLWRKSPQQQQQPEGNTTMGAVITL